MEGGGGKAPFGPPGYAPASMVGMRMDEDEDGGGGWSKEDEGTGTRGDILGNFNHQTKEFPT